MLCEFLYMHMNKEAMLLNYIKTSLDMFQCCGLGDWCYYFIVEMHRKLDIIGPSVPPECKGSGGFRRVGIGVKGFNDTQGIMKKNFLNPFCTFGLLPLRKAHFQVFLNNQSPSFN